MDQYLLEQIKNNPGESHTELANKIMDNPFAEGRSFKAVVQRIGWMRPKNSKEDI